MISPAAGTWRAGRGLEAGAGRRRSRSVDEGQRRKGETIGQARPVRAAAGASEGRGRSLGGSPEAGVKAAAKEASARCDVGTGGCDCITHARRLTYPGVPSVPSSAKILEAILGFPTLGNSLRDFYQGLDENHEVRPLAGDQSAILGDLQDAFVAVLTLYTDLSSHRISRLRNIAVLDLLTSDAGLLFFDLEDGAARGTGWSGTVNVAHLEVYQAAGAAAGARPWDPSSFIHVTAYRPAGGGPRRGRLIVPRLAVELLRVYHFQYERIHGKGAAGADVTAGIKPTRCVGKIARYFKRKYGVHQELSLASIRLSRVAYIY